MFARPIDDVDKVPNPTVIEYPVVEIAADAGGKKPKCSINQPAFNFAEKENHKDYSQSNQRDRYKQISPPCRYSESGAGIFNRYQSEKTVYNRDTAVLLPA